MAGKAPQNAYLQTQIKTASKEQLLVMLFDGAIRFAHQAKAAIEARQIEQSSNLCIKVQNIVNELMSSLDRDLITPELYSNLMSLYNFVHKRMVSANIERNPDHIDEAIDILNRLRLVWKDAIDAVLIEHGGRIPDRSEVDVSKEAVAANAAPKAVLPNQGIVAAPRPGQLTAQESRPVTLGRNTAHSAYASGRAASDRAAADRAAAAESADAGQKFPLPAAASANPPTAAPPKPPASGPTAPGPVPPASRPPAPPPGRPPFPPPPPGRPPMPPPGAPRGQENGAAAKQPAEAEVPPPSPGKPRINLNKR